MREEKKKLGSLRAVRYNVTDSSVRLSDWSYKAGIEPETTRLSSELLNHATIPISFPRSTLQTMTSA